MSEENVDAWRRAVDAYNRGDTEGAVEIYDRDVEWRPAVQRLLGGDTAVYRGRDGARELLQDLDETFAEIRIEIAESSRPRRSGTVLGAFPRTREGERRRDPLADRRTRSTNSSAVMAPS
jgi:SnoaL-like domain